MANLLACAPSGAQALSLPDSSRAGGHRPADDRRASSSERFRGCLDMTNR